MSSLAPPRPNLLATAAYAAGSFGTGVFSTVPAILLLYFCTETLRLPAAWAGVVVFVPKVWAIAWDPLVGLASDRSRSRFGRRRPFLLLGAVGVALAFVAVFSPPVLGRAATFAWMTAAYFLLATVYSVFAVPYVAIPSALAAETDTRARLVGWRMFVAMIGVLAGAGLVPHIVQLAGGGRTGYRTMSVLIAGACLLTMCAPLLMLAGRDPPASRAGGSDTRSAGIWRQLVQTIQHRRFVYLSCSYVLQLTAVGILSASAPYLVTGAFGRGEGDVGTAMIGMLSATTIATPVWAWLGRRYGNSRALVVSVILFALGTGAIGWLAAVSAGWAFAKLAFIFAGIPFAGMQVLPYTLAAHLIHESQHSGASTFTGVWTACEKLGLAFGPALTAFTLAIGSAQRIESVASLVIVGPCLLGLLSLPLLRRAAGPRHSSQQASLGQIGG